MKVQKARSPFSPQTAADVSSRLHAAANPEKAGILQSFFKTGPGEYAEGDVFLGLTMPIVRNLVHEFAGLAPREALKLVRSRIHEERMTGLLLWVAAFERGDEGARRKIFDLYCRNRQHVNNWDLVDLSAPGIVGGSLAPGNVRLLNQWAKSNRVWDRRIAVLATFKFIRDGQFQPSLDLCRHLIEDKHDLIHKACGWMLREIGKRDRKVLSRFLERHAAEMPRTMLRYALEHYDEAERGRLMGLGKAGRR